MIFSLLRKTPDFKGKQRLARFLLRFHFKLKQQIGVMVNGKGGCVYKLPNVNENIGFEILINGMYEPGTVNFICERTPRNSIFLDIGANIGAITVPIRSQRSDIEVVALEASPWVFDYLNSNIQNNQLTKVKTINRAISSESGTQVEFFSPKDKFGMGSMSPVFTDEAVKVDTITLDDISETLKPKSIGFIKIDIEGFEMKAFMGGVNLLRQDGAPDILFEFVDWAEKLANEQPGTAQSVLLSYGYNLFLLENGKIGNQIFSPILKGACMIFGTKRK